MTKYTKPRLQCKQHNKEIRKNPLISGNLQERGQFNLCHIQTNKVEILNKNFLIIVKALNFIADLNKIISYNDSIWVSTIKENTETSKMYYCVQYFRSITHQR